LGMPLAWAATRMLARSATLPTDVPMAVAPRIDWRVEALALSVTAVAAIACAVAPWITARRVEITAMLRRRNSSGSAGGKTASATVLVAVEIALAVALVT